MSKESAATSARVSMAAGAKASMVTGAKASTSRSKKQDIKSEQDEGSSSDYPKVEIKRLGYILFYIFLT